VLQYLPHTNHFRRGFWRNTDRRTISICSQYSHITKSRAFKLLQRTSEIQSSGLFPLSLIASQRKVVVGSVTLSSFVSVSIVHRISSTHVSLRLPLSHLPLILHLTDDISLAFYLRNWQFWKDILLLLYKYKYCSSCATKISNAADNTKRHFYRFRNRELCYSCSTTIVLFFDRKPSCSISKPRRGWRSTGCWLSDRQFSQEAYQDEKIQCNGPEVESNLSKSTTYIFMILFCCARRYIT
jgi:hypothetical protein